MTGQFIQSLPITIMITLTVSLLLALGWLGETSGLLLILAGAVFSRRELR